MKNEIKLNNVIFPLWLLFFTPPFFLIPLFGNFIVDAFVIRLGLKRMAVVMSPKQSWKVIVVSWVLGFLADLISFLIVLVNMMRQDFLASFGIRFDEYNIWSSPATLLLMCLAIFVGGLTIYFLNRYWFVRCGIDLSKAKKLAMWMAIITAPWMFLIPTPFWW